MLIEAFVRTSRIAARSARLVAGLRWAERITGGPSEALTSLYVKRWGKAMLDALEVEVTQVGTPPPDGGVIVVSNHRSFIDIPLLLSRFGGQLLSRGDVADWPILGTLANIGGTHFVDRADKTNGAAALRKMVTRLRTGGTLGVFAEGTTFTDDEVRPFLPGAFLAARQSATPILPVGLAYGQTSAMFGDESFGEHAKHLFALPRIKVAIAIGNAIAPTEKPAELAEKTRAEVQKLVDQARAWLPLQSD